jgi:hypothetical protein
MDSQSQTELLRLKNIIVTKFTEENWLELGLITASVEIIRDHGRLLRSLAWDDSDYPGNALSVLMAVISAAPENFGRIRDYVDEKFPPDGEVFVSSKPQQKRIIFSPSVFEIPDAVQDENLVAVMMPFSQEFRGVYDAIKSACSSMGFDCKRADDIWEHSILVQDIFRLIFTARIVISDFTGRNPNVMYETGIAHTLGKIVVPITQIEKDIPFDVVHHRYLSYLPNGEGLTALSDGLQHRLRGLKS